MLQHLTDVFPMPKSFKHEVGQNFELKGSWWNGVTGVARNVLHLCIVTSYDDAYQWNRPVETGAIYFQVCAENRSEEDEEPYPIRRKDYAKAKHEYLKKNKPVAEETPVAMEVDGQAGNSADPQTSGEKETSMIWVYCLKISEGERTRYPGKTHKCTICGEQVQLTCAVH